MMTVRVSHNTVKSAFNDMWLLFKCDATKEAKEKAWEIFKSLNPGSIEVSYFLVFYHLPEPYEKLAWEFFCSLHPSNRDWRFIVRHAPNISHRMLAWFMLYNSKPSNDDLFYIINGLDYDISGNIVHKTPEYIRRGAARLLLERSCEYKYLIAISCHALKIEAEAAFQLLARQWPNNEELRLIIRDSEYSDIQERAWQKLLEQDATFVDMKWIDHNAPREYKEKARVEYERMRKEASGA